MNGARGTGQGQGRPQPSKRSSRSRRSRKQCSATPIIGDDSSVSVPASSIRRGAKKATGKGKSGWVDADGNLMQCRCSAQLGGPHATPGGCALALLLHSSVSMITADTECLRDERYRDVSCSRCKDATCSRCNPPSIFTSRRTYSMPFEIAFAECLNGLVDRAHAEGVSTSDSISQARRMIDLANELEHEEDAMLDEHD